jgi:2-methylisocitrate lyase-like PEP mutase family enzyme
MLFPNTLEEVRLAPREIEAPLIYVNSNGNRVGRPVLPVAELANLGYAMVMYATATVLVVYEAVQALFARLRECGEDGLDPEVMIRARSGIEDLIGLPLLYAIEERTTERASS